MAKKTAKKKVSKKKVTKKTAAKSTTATNRIQDYSREIWLAGLGAFALAQEEGGKVLEKGGKVLEQGGQMFDRLVAEGAKIEGKGRKAASDTVGGLRDDVESRVGQVRKSAQSNWDKLEKVFEQRVARALSKLGVPTSDEIQELSKRVQELNTRVRDLAKAQQNQNTAGKSGGGA